MDHPLDGKRCDAGEIAQRSSCVRLIVGSERVTEMSDYTIRFVDSEQKPPTPVLYFRGRRVTSQWSLQLSHDAEPDRYGCSG